MISFIKFVRFAHSLFNISKNNMNKEKCYFRYVTQEDNVDISFLFTVNNVSRQFNLRRKLTENLETLCSRIAANVQKIVNKKKKKSNVNEHIIEVKVCDSKQDPISRELTVDDLLSYEKPTLWISDKFYEIVLNPPWIAFFDLPKTILAGFPVYPENFDAQNTDIPLSKFNWYRGKAHNEKGNGISEEHINWEFITSSFYYTPSARDVKMKLKLLCIPANQKMTGPAVEYVMDDVVEAGPGPCPFEMRHMFTMQKLTSKGCVSYNILADLYCDSVYTRTVLHPYCPPYALHIDYRKQLILKELIGYNADIICLQEVDRKCFNSSFKTFLECNGFKGQFFKKGRTVAEGLACFYREDRFKSIGHASILLAEAIKTEGYLKGIWDKIKENEYLSRRFWDRSTVASVTFLQSTENLNEILLIGNTHLYFHPDADHIRLLQGGVVIYWLKHVQKQVQEQYANHRVSLILCGDFNSVPSCGLYQLYTTGSAPSTLPDWCSNEVEAVSGLTLTQDILLESACGTPQYTNFTEGFADCLDYIFYEKGKLKVEQVIPFPTIEQLKAHTALPSIVFPSDHIAVVSDLKFV